MANTDRRNCKLCGVRSYGRLCMNCNIKTAVHYTPKVGPRKKSTYGEKYPDLVKQIADRLIGEKHRKL